MAKSTKEVKSRRKSKSERTIEAQNELMNELAINDNAEIEISPKDTPNDKKEIRFNRPLRKL